MPMFSSTVQRERLTGAAHDAWDEARRGRIGERAYVDFRQIRSYVPREQMPYVVLVSPTRYVVWYPMLGEWYDLIPDEYPVDMLAEVLASLEDEHRPRTAEARRAWLAA